MGHDGDEHLGLCRHGKRKHGLNAWEGRIIHPAHGQGHRFWRKGEWEGALSTLQLVLPKQMALACLCVTLFKTVLSGWFFFVFYLLMALEPLLLWHWMPAVSKMGSPAQPGATPCRDPHNGATPRFIIQRLAGAAPPFRLSVPQRERQASHPAVHTCHTIDGGL